MPAGEVGTGHAVPETEQLTPTELFGRSRQSKSFCVCVRGAGVQLLSHRRGLSRRDGLDTRTRESALSGGSMSELAAGKGGRLAWTQARKSRRSGNLDMGRAVL